MRPREAAPILKGQGRKDLFGVDTGLPIACPLEQDVILSRSHA